MNKSKSNNILIIALIIALILLAAIILNNQNSSKVDDKLVGVWLKGETESLHSESVEIDENGNVHAYADYHKNDESNYYGEAFWDCEYTGYVEDGKFILTSYRSTHIEFSTDAQGNEFGYEVPDTDWQEVEIEVTYEFTSDDELNISGAGEDSSFIGGSFVRQ